MDLNIEAYMRTGIVHFMAFPELASGGGPWEETVRHIALDPFFNAIEITHIEDPGIRERVKDIIHLARLGVNYDAHPTILAQGLNPNALDKEERTHTCTVLKRQIDEAVYMGAENFVILSGKDPGEPKRQEALACLTKTLKELCAYSESRGGPQIIVEIFDREVDKCCLLGPALLGRDVAQAVSEECDNFGLIVDLSHIPLLRESPEQSLEPVKDYITGAHLGNAVTDPQCAGYGDNHPIFGMPGSANDVPEVTDFLRTLLGIGFLRRNQPPIVSFEIKPMEGQDPLVMIANAKRVLKEAWAQV